MEVDVSEEQTYTSGAYGGQLYSYGKVNVQGDHSIILNGTNTSHAVVFKIRGYEDGELSDTALGAEPLIFKVSVLQQDDGDWRILNVHAPPPADASDPECGKEDGYQDPLQWFTVAGDQEYADGADIGDTDYGDSDAGPHDDSL